MPMLFIINQMKGNEVVTPKYLPQERDIRTGRPIAFMAITEKEVIDMYKNGETMAAIGKAAGCSYQSIRRRLKKAGVYKGKSK